jgi:hypothetical protein
MNKEAIEKSKTGLMIGLGVAWIFLVILAIVAQFAIPAFESVFGSFGTDLPAMTMFAVAYHRGALLLPIVTGLVLAFWPSKPANVIAALVFACLSIIAINLMFFSLYLPIFKLGEIV